VLNHNCQAQGIDSTRAFYIDNRTKEIGISIYSMAQNNTLTIDAQKRLELKANDIGGLGIRLQHKWLGLSLVYSPDQFQEPNKGKTSEFDLGVHMYGKKHIVDAFFIFYKGFYINNYKEVDSLRTRYNTYPILPEMRMRTVGLNYTYLFNHKKFSMRSSFLFNEIQKRSAGSALFNVSLSYLKLSNPDAIVPDELTLSFQNKDRIKSGAFYAASVMPGYAHTFVIKRFFFTIAPSLGIMLQHHQFNADNNAQSNLLQISGRGIARIAIGYNSNRFFIGMRSVADTYNYELNKNINLLLALGDARLHVGYRFIPKGTLKAASNYMEKVPIRYY